MIPLPPQLVPVLAAVRKIGRPRLVGGCVRDALLGQAADDIDIEVAETSFDALVDSLAPFGATDVVGRSFGTVKLKTQGISYDFSLPRRESKTGAGHRGFKIAAGLDLSDAETAARRDFTINAIAWDPFTQELVDPHGGQQDLQAGILRHVGPAFAEDPLRVLRAMQLAARFDFSLAPETAALARRISSSYAELPPERIWGEWQKWATLAQRPSRGLAVLQQTGWIHHFPEIAALAGTPQEPEWHPEGDVLVHTGHCLDALVQSLRWSQATAERRQVLALAVLAHDFGKPTTTTRIDSRGQSRWTSPGHAAVGAALAQSFLPRIGAPLRIASEVVPLVQFHLAFHDGGKHLPGDSLIRRLACKIAPATLDDLLEVMRADFRGRPPLENIAMLRRLDQIAARAEELAVQDRAPAPIVQGRHLIARGLSPGPDFGPLIAEAYAAQLDGDFEDEAGSSRWLDSRLKKHRA